MVAKTERGFTIVEVVLFLAITGMLFAALMIGVGSAVTQQRYLDSVRSFKALVQNEFSEVASINNQSNRDQGCNASTGATNVNPRGTRGASNCVVLGRAVLINGPRVTTAMVTAPERSLDDIERMDELTAFQYYQPRLSGNNLQDTEINWSSQLTAPDTNNPLKAVILILRAPVGGAIRVFATTLTPTESMPGSGGLLSPARFITPTTTELKACVDGDSGVMPKQMVVVSPAVAGPDGVTITPDAAGCQS